MKHDNAQCTRGQSANKPYVGVLLGDDKGESTFGDAIGDITLHARTKSMHTDNTTRTWAVCALRQQSPLRVRAARWPTRRRLLSLAAAVSYARVCRVLDSAVTPDHVITHAKHTVTRANGWYCERRRSLSMRALAQAHINTHRITHNHDYIRTLLPTRHQHHSSRVRWRDRARRRQPALTDSLSSCCHRHHHRRLCCCCCWQT
jgi:hypothetical protein